MSRLFISHSSWNNDKAVEVRAWLAKNGWDDVFLDLDPVRGIAAGQRWKEAPQKAAWRCEVVLALVSKEWIASSWCKSEVDAARMMGKKVIAALVGIDKTQVPPDLTDEQYVDLTGDPDAYPRLKEGLKRAGLDPTTFPFPPGRLPYPGFAYLEEDDAAVFFGRDAQIVRGLDEIRRLARAGISRMFVILGASGSGKSSYLRAGLWPRLKRDDLAWLPLPVVRPECAAFSGKYGLAESLYAAVSEPRFAEGIRQRGLPRSRVDIRDFVEKEEDGLAKLFAALRDVAQAAASGENSAPPTILLAIDQGEELFNEEDRDEARRFIDTLTKTLAADPRALAILVMRSDAFPLVQNEPALAALPKDTFTLDMMLESSYRAVIEGPARLLDPPLLLDPQLVDALLEDISGQDALPLLAFTLRHLCDNYLADNELKLASYDRIGRVKGVIAQTVEQAFAQAVTKGEAPKDGEERLRLARSAFIPHLAQVNPAGQFVRRVSPRDKIPPEARPLVDRFAEQRLLIRDRRQDAEVLEVAHETLLRQPPFSDWLAEDREFLQWRDRLTQARAAFETKQRGLLIGRELDVASDYQSKRSEGEIDPADQAFICDSIAADDKRLADEAEQTRAKENAQREALEQRVRAAEQIAEGQKRAIANLHDAQMAQSRFLADQARQQRAGGDAGTAILLALEALPDHAAGVDRPYVPEAELQLDRARRDLRERLVLVDEDEVTGATFSPDGQHIVTAPWGTTVRIWDAVTGMPTGKPLKGHKDRVRSAAFSADGKRIVTASQDATVRIWDASSGKPIGKPLKAHKSPVCNAMFNPDGTRIVTASMDGTARIWDAASGKAIGEPLEGHHWPVWSAAFSPDGTRVVTGSQDKTARIWDASTGKPIGDPLTGHEDMVRRAAFNPDGRRIVTASEDKTARLWDVESGKEIYEPLRGHEDVLRSAAFSPDGQRIATASFDGTARIWDAASGDPIGEPFKGHQGPVFGAAFSSDGRRILTASADKTARIWDAISGRPIGKALISHEDWVWIAVSPDGRRIVIRSFFGNGARILDARNGEGIGEFIGHAASVISAAFSPDGQRIVTASLDKTARIWDAATGKPIGKPLKAHEDELRSAAFSPDGQRIVTTFWNILGRTARILDATSGETIGQPLANAVEGWSVVSPDGQRIVTASFFDKTARILDVSSGEPLTGHTDAVMSAAFSPDSKRLVTVSADKTARIWDAVIGQPIGEPLRGHEDAVWSAAFSPDGKRILTVSADKTARIWDAATGKSIVDPLKELEHAVVGAAFSPDGKRIVTASLGWTARFWDAATGKPASELLRAHDDNVHTAIFSPDGQRIITASLDWTARIWDAATGKPIVEPLVGHAGVVRSAAFSADGKRVVTASDDKTVRIWDSATGKPIAEPLVGHAGVVSSAMFSADGKRIVTVSADKTARIWNAATGKPIGEPLTIQEFFTFGAALGPDGKFIVTESDNRTVRIWDAVTAQPIGELLKGHENAVTSAAFSPDSKRIVTASHDKTAPIWDAATGQSVGEPLRGHEDAVWSAAFSPDGQRVVTASLDKTARIRDAATGQPIGEPLKGHDDWVWSAAFSPNGKRIVTASRDKTARVWDAESGKPISELKGHYDAVFSAAFSRDGKRIVTASHDKTARIWDVFTDTQALVSAAKAAVPRCLTTSQRKAFFLPPEPPFWCIEMAKWPYDTLKWKQWLTDKRAGKNPPLPAAP